MAVKSTVTPYFYAVIAWAAIPSFQCGYHLSALNQLQHAMSCRTSSRVPSFLSLPSCIEMEDTAFGILTSMFTVGGLLGSLTAGYFMNTYGRKGAANSSCALVFLGSAIMSIASTYFELLVGRFLLGIGTGMGVCVVPIYLAELSRPAMRGSICVVNQLAIVTGLLVTQTLGIPLAFPSIWRFVLIFSVVLSVIQLFFAPLMVDTPVWLANEGKKIEADFTTSCLWGNDLSDEDIEEAEPTEQEPLLDATDEMVPPPHTIGIWTLLRSKELRPSVIVVLFAFLGQQGSGINAILYFSNGILARVMPALAAYISLLIIAVNLVMTFPPMFLVDIIGRRRMFMISLFGSCVCLCTTAVGINVSHAVLSSVGVLGFVAIFSVGLGPVPVIMMTELLPFPAIGSISAVVGSFNSLINIALAMGFLPLRQILAGPARQDGNVFFVFAAVLAVVCIVVMRMYHP